MIGKLDPDDLARVLSRTGASDDDVVMGPQYGEDAAGIALDDQLLVVNSDPLSLAEERLGTLAVHVACNDVAASGADPRWLTNVIFLPDDDPDTLDQLTTQLDEEARKLGVAIVGGHSEYAPALDRPMASLTAMGLAEEFVPTGGAEPGDRVLLTKGAGVEGTAVLATDFREELTSSGDSSAGVTSGDSSAGVTTELLDRAESFYREISVVPEAAILRERATAMHDPTEGGLVNGLVELATASGVRLDIEREAIPIREETAELCAAMDVDPLRIFGSGALVATVPEEYADEMVEAVESAGIRVSEIGVVREEADAEEPGVELDGELISDAVRDDLYDLWE